MHSAGDHWRLGRRPALDGLRGVAILLVLASHSQIPKLSGAGAVGVAVFFTLSGFLITALLVEETSRTGRLDLRRFYARRARRLLPALFAMLAVVTALGLAIGSGYAERTPMIGTLLYSNNWVMISGAHRYDALSHTWSLSIEEQFYFVWPIVVLLLRRRPRTLLAVALVGAAGSALLRFVLWEHGASWYRLYFGTDTRADGLLIGAALAVAMTLWGAPRLPATTAAVALAAITAWVVPMSVHSVVVTMPLAVSLTTALVLAATCGRGSSRLLLLTPLRWLGARSYAVYLWQVPVMALLIGFRAPWPVIAMVLTPTSIGLAALSWRYVEQPIQQGGSERRSRAVAPSLQVAEVH